TEKNATPWSKDKLDELFKGLEVTTNKATLRITNLTKAEGEAYVNNRKAKLIFFYEWIIELEWAGSLAESDNVLKGKIEIPNLSEENEVHEIDVLMRVNKRNNESDKLLDAIKNETVAKLREKLGQYIHQLKNEFIQGMILPSKDNKATPNNPQVNKAEKEVQSNLFITNTLTCTLLVDAKPLGVPIATKKLVMKEEFLMSAEDLYSTLTEEQRVSAFTQNPSKVDATRGGSFVLLNGSVSGKFVELVRDEKIVMEWRQKSWPEGHHSTATITLTQEDDRTVLKLTQSGIPESKYEETKQGWKCYYWEAIKRTFSCGFRYF
ncbi:hypothetical protein QZH41_016935, partial [Actinostola sp. cb2023]